VAEGKTAKEALRALKRQVSDEIFKHLKADAARAARAVTASGPGGQPGNDSVASAAGSHPERRLFGQATPGPAPTLRSRPRTPARKAAPRTTKRSAEPLDAKRSRYASRRTRRYDPGEASRNGRSAHGDVPPDGGDHPWSPRRGFAPSFKGVTGSPASPRARASWAGTR
jgi:hypothetical protein